MDMPFGSKPSVRLHCLAGRIVDQQTADVKFSAHVRFAPVAVLGAVDFGGLSSDQTAIESRQVDAAATKQAA
jgi:hypothetical protein